MENNFETGATNAPSNNLVLSVMNDGAIYSDRMHCGYALLQGASHRFTFRELVNSEAAKQRKTFGSKFTASQISEAARIVRDQTITHCLESIRESWNGAPIQCHGRLWWDRINGNTYFSAKICVPCDTGFRVFTVPFQYGYGDQWQWECVHTLRRMGFDLPENVAWSTLPLHFDNAPHMRKNQMYSGIYIKGE